MEQLFSALHLKADSNQTSRHDRFMPKNRLMHRKTALLFDHFVGADKQRRRKVGLSALLRSGWERTDRRLSPSSFFAK
jgi:hypothetical protein